MTVASGPDSVLPANQPLTAADPDPAEQRYTLEVRAALSLVAHASPPRNLGGRPKVVDEIAKAKIAALTAAGLSLRQVAGFLGITHPTVADAIAADPELKQEIENARQRAQLHPLACILRESGRNWKAAVWLLNHLKDLAWNDQPRQERVREAAEAEAAEGIRFDLSQEIREEARRARRKERRQKEDDEWRKVIAAKEEAKKQKRQASKAYKSGVQSAT